MKYRGYPWDAWEYSPNILKTALVIAGHPAECPHVNPTAGEHWLLVGH